MLPVMEIQGPRTMHLLTGAPGHEMLCRQANVDDLGTFDVGAVTCPECKAKMPKVKEPRKPEWAERGFRSQEDMDYALALNRLADEAERGDVKAETMWRLEVSTEKLRSAVGADMAKYSALAECPAGHTGYLALLDQMKALHIKKAKDYGVEDDPLRNIRGSEDIGIPADKGAWLRALDKVRRINRHYSGHELANESLEDSLMDLAAYALIALAIRRERGT